MSSISNAMSEVESMIAEKENAKQGKSTAEKIKYETQIVKLRNFKIALSELRYNGVKCNISDLVKELEPDCADIVTRYYEYLKNVKKVSTTKPIPKKDKYVNVLALIEKAEQTEKSEDFFNAADEIKKVPVEDQKRFIDRLIALSEKNKVNFDKLLSFAEKNEDKVTLEIIDD